MAVIATPNATTITPSCPALPNNALAVTPSDADTFAQGVSIYAGAAGNISCVPWSSETAVVVAVLAGTVVPFRVKKVNATGTTATGLVAVY